MQKVRHTGQKSGKNTGKNTRNEQNNEKSTEPQDQPTDQKKRPKKKPLTQKKKFWVILYPHSPNQREKTVPHAPNGANSP